MYANEANGKFPPRIADSDQDIAYLQIYPEYLTDLSILLCPSDIEGIEEIEEMQRICNDYKCFRSPDDPLIDGNYGKCAMSYQSYYYTGYALAGPEDDDDNLEYNADGSVNTTGSSIVLRKAHGAMGYEWLATMGFTGNEDALANLPFLPPYAIWEGFMSCYGPATNAPVPSEFPHDGTAQNGRFYYALTEGIERFLITDINNPAGSARAQSTIPVMMDQIQIRTKSGLGMYKLERTNHLPGGCNVLYMDGHVEFVKYPTKWPVSQNSGFVLRS